MLGIVFTGGDSPPARTASFIAGGRGALIVAADSGLLAAEAAGFTPDWIVGDMDSLDSLERLDAYPPGRVVRHGRDKDFTDTELAFSLALDAGCRDIWIIGGGGGRIDHLFGIRSLFEREVFPRRWVTAGEDIFCIEGSEGATGCQRETVSERVKWAEGREMGDGCKVGKSETEEAAGRSRLSLKTAPGDIISVFPLGGGVWKAASKGLKWPLDGLSWNRGFFGLSNVALEENISITAAAGRFMVIAGLPEGDTV
ncbi:MAG: thiamine diphosphokinase [Spirochaetes bacterium]|nr:thiamine diphosphokinase [Spirochaetota bacterium]